MMFGEFQEFYAYCDSIRAEKISEMLEKIGVKKKDKADSLSDYMSDDDEGVLTPIESDGITVYDLPELLHDAGMVLNS